MNDIKKNVKLPNDFTQYIQKELESFKNEIMKKNPKNLNLKDPNEYYTFFGHINQDIPDELVLIANPVKIT